MNNQEEKHGTLILCATPIGNLGDISHRALETLKACDIIAAEDTRRTIQLLNHYQIKKPMVSYHQHNEKEREQQILSFLSEGKQVVLVSDAGMPGISDPGADLVRVAISGGYGVTAIPGPSAFLLGLVLSGLPCDRFVFEGFLPRKKKDRIDQLKFLSQETRTIVLYEAPHRLLATLLEMRDHMGENRMMAVARELTKHFEEIRRGTVGEMVVFYTTVKPRGEFVLVIHGADVSGQEKITEQANRTDAYALAKQKILDGMTLKDAARFAAVETGVSRRDLYNRLIDRGQSQSKSNQEDKPNGGPDY